MPGATEIVCALGLEDSLVGISHECDYPPSIRRKSVVVKPLIKTTQMSEREIDDAIRNNLRDGKALYELDFKLLNKLKPDLVIAQDLCDVCSISKNYLQELVHQFPYTEVVFLSPKTLDDILNDLLTIGQVTHQPARAQELLEDLHQRIGFIQSTARSISHLPKVFFAEWLDPVFCAGHWMGQMIELAGGHDIFAQKGKKALVTTWQSVIDFSPEILVLSPCGYDLAQVVRQKHIVAGLSWTRPPKTYAVNANAYFSRPGPRVVSGLEILARIFHPERLNNLKVPSNSFEMMSLNNRNSPAIHESETEGKWLNSYSHCDTIKKVFIHKSY